VILQKGSAACSLEDILPWPKGKRACIKKLSEKTDIRVHEFIHDRVNAAIVSA